MIVTGSNSMIGSRFLELNSADLPNLKTLDYPEIDLVKISTHEILAKLSDYIGDVLIHFAAFTDVNRAQIEQGDKKGICWQLNVEGTKKLVAVAQKLNLKMVYISTDFVFDGKSGPYFENDKTAESENDISWYGWTKLTGEKILQNSGVDFLIARTSYPYRANFAAKSDFVRNIIEKLKIGSLYPMFSDQFLTPTFVDNFVRALLILIRENQTGIWHVVDNTTLTAYEAAVEIAKVFGFDFRFVKKASLTEFQKENPQAAKRPVAGGLKNDKLRKFLANFGQDMQDFSQALVTLKNQITN